VCFKACLNSTPSTGAVNSSVTHFTALPQALYIQSIITSVVLVYIKGWGEGNLSTFWRQLGGNSFQSLTEKRKTV